MKWFIKKKKQIYLVIAGVLTLGSFAGFGGYFMDRSPLDAAVVIGDRKIPYKRFQSIYQRALEQQKNASPTPLTDPMRDMVKRQVVQMLVQETVFLNEAERYGVRVTDTELGQMIQTIPEFKTENRFDPRRYQQLLAQNRFSVAEFENDQRRQIQIQKTQFLMASAVKISPMEFDRAYHAALVQAKPEDQKKLLENPDEFRQQLRSQEIQATLQDWYTATSTQLKVRVNVDKLEGKTQTS
jgi:hypothetical protein